MNVKDKIYTETICFRATPELKALFSSAQAADKAKFIRILTEVCKQLNKSTRQDVIRDESTVNDGVLRDEDNKAEHKSTNHDVIRDKKKKVKVVEKSMFEQDMEAKAEYESKHNINRLF